MLPLFVVEPKRVKPVPALGFMIVDALVHCWGLKHRWEVLEAILTLCPHPVGSPKRTEFTKVLVNMLQWKAPIG